MLEYRGSTETEGFGARKAAQDRGGQAGGGALHERVGSEDGHGAGLSVPDLSDRVAGPHQASQTTTAAAMPASWVIERWMVAMPRSATSAATVPEHSK